MIQMNLFTKQKQTHRLREGTYGYQGGSKGAEWEFGISRCKLLHIFNRMDKQQGHTIEHRELYPISCDKP